MLCNGFALPRKENENGKKQQGGYELCKLGYSLRVSVRNIETIKDTGMYMAPNIQLFELDIDKESNIGKFFKGSDLVIGAIGPSADYSETRKIIV